MRKHVRKRFRILLIEDLRQKASRESLRGVLRFAALHDDWTLQIANAHPANEPSPDCLHQTYDGLISDFSWRAFPKPFLGSLNLKAAIFLDLPLPTPMPTRRYGLVLSDNKAIACEAARFFLDRHFTNFAFVGSPRHDNWSQERFRHFAQFIRKRGYSVSSFEPDPHALEHDSEFAQLQKWLVSLPRPCALFAAYDHRAKHVIDACRQAGIGVPQQISVLGVDNDTDICEQTIPSISSITPEFYRAGLAAANMLDAMLRNTKRKPRRKLYGTLGIVERMSTADVRGIMRTVSRAREFIRNHGTEGISVQDVALAARTSVRYLEMNFREALGTTVIQTIQNTRLAHVRELLLSTRTPISAIAKLSGFKNENYLKNLFRRKLGVSMSRWRASNAVSDGDSDSRRTGS